MARHVQILGTGQLLELQRRLRAAGHEHVRRSMTRRIRAAAEPLQRDLQRTVRTMDIRSTGAASRGGRGGRAHPLGLRESIARAIRISVRTTGNPGAKVWIDKSRLPPDIRNMPERLNDGRWRHPVFGNRHRWATQYAQAGWWPRTVAAHETRMRQQVAHVLDDVRARLEHG